MKVEYHDKPGMKPYFTVLVDSEELELEGGRRMDFSTWLGTIDLDGTINQWTPAGGCPRGYKKAAMRELERVRDELRRDGKIR